MRAQDTTTQNRPSPQVTIYTRTGEQVMLEVLNRKKVQGDDYVLAEVPNGDTLILQAFRALPNQAVQFTQDDALYELVMRELAE